jgi:hypothetical protein
LWKLWQIEDLKSVKALMLILTLPTHLYKYFWFCNYHDLYNYHSTHYDCHHHNSDHYI